MKHVQTIKDAWNQWSDTDFAKYHADERIAKIIERPESVFHQTTYSMIQQALPSMEGKRIFVPSSGDNHAVFAFHLMGAKVTSADISERQLEHAARIASKHGWKIDFLCENTMALSTIDEGQFDFVYTSNGVHVWIDDLSSMYRNIYRILKRGGAYLMYEVHPYIRPFADDTTKLTVVKPYDATGPFGEIPTYAWRMQDILNAIAHSGLTLQHVEEMFAEYDTFWFEVSGDRERMTKEEIDRLYNWQCNPMAALPQWLSVYGRK